MSSSQHKGPAHHAAAGSQSDHQQQHQPLLLPSKHTSAKKPTARPDGSGAPSDGGHVSGGSDWALLCTGCGNTGVLGPERVQLVGGQEVVAACTPATLRAVHALGGHTGDCGFSILASRASTVAGHLLWGNTSGGHKCGERMSEERPAVVVLLRLQ
jgi:hypothetical protein